MDDNLALTIQAPSRDTQVELVRARLRLARGRTRERLHDLREEVAEKTNWEAWYRKAPVPFLAAAFLFGFLLAKRR